MDEYLYFLHRPSAKSFFEISLAAGKELDTLTALRPKGWRKGSESRGEVS
jgi:hypothetical protein